MIRARKTGNAGRKDDKNKSGWGVKSLGIILKEWGVIVSKGGLEVPEEARTSRGGGGVCGGKGGAK